MYEFEISKWSDSHQFSASNAYKKRFLFIITAICWTVYLPVTIIHAYEGYLLICLFNVGYILALSIAAAYVYITGKGIPLFSLSVILAFLILSYITPIYYLGIKAVLWGFPIVIVLFFLLPFWLAFITNSILITLSGAMCLWLIEASISIRIVTALVITFVISGVLSKKIRTMQYQLKKISDTDPLTGAYNRRQLKSFLDDSWSQFQHYKTTSVIAILDLDHFKSINDTLGHDAGDNTIIELVKLIQANVRDSDPVFRLGGDEILLLLRNITKEDAVAKLSVLCSCISKSQLIKTTASIGAAPVYLASDTEMWVKKADDALYRAKELGRNQLIIHDYDESGLVKLTFKKMQASHGINFLKTPA